MSSLQIELASGRTEYRPGEQVAGTASWAMDRPVRSLAIELLWTTRGKGTVDTQVVASATLSGPAAGRQEFRLQLPQMPYSFSGKLLSLMWMLRLANADTKEEATANITMSPTGREIQLLASSETDAGSR